MSQSLYEQYKDALRRGHVAALRGRLDDALAAYEAAANIAPDRALPHSSLGDVLHRLGRIDAAEVAYAAALRRVPSDEAALRGRAAMRAAQGSRLDAAGDYEALAASFERAGRLVDACDAARRALELAESRTRRRAVERLAALLREQDANPSAAEALRLAMLLLEPMHGGSTTTPPDAGPGVRSEAGSPVEALAAAGDAPAGQGAIPTPALVPEEAPFDPAAALLEAEALLDARDVPAAREKLLDLAAQQRALGRLDAALDACLVLMAIDPSDAVLQLEIAANQAARGWSGLAAEKVRLLARLADLDGDATAAAAVAAFAGRHGFASEQDSTVPAPEPDAAG